MTGTLPGLPGSADDPGTGPVVDVLVDDLLADAPLPPARRTAGEPTAPPDATPAAGDGAVPIERAVTEEALAVHREHRAAWYGDLVGPLRVPASAVPDVVACLHPRDHLLRVTLVATPHAADPLGELREARGLLVDDDRIDVVGVELPLPAAPATASGAEMAARAALAELDLSVPTWFVVPPDEAWLPALDVLAEDRAESLALHLAPDAQPTAAAALLRRAVDLDLSVAVTAGDLPVITSAAGCGLLNLLCAVRAALNGAGTDEVAGVLATERAEPLASAARRMSDADAAVVRAFLPLVTCPSVRAVVEHLEALGLIAPDAA